MDDILHLKLTKGEFVSIGKDAKFSEEDSSRFWDLLNEFARNRNKSEAIQRLTLPLKAVTKGSDGKITINKSELGNSTPLMVFVNNKSGGQQGKEVGMELKKLLNPDQVFDLIADKGPQKGLEIFKDVPNARVLICGGDGTVGWYLNTIDALQFKNQPPAAVLPLGTGNDLARALGWGPGYTGEDLTKIIAQVGFATSVKLDRWMVESPSDQQTSSPGGSPKPKRIMNNYYSIGLDAHIATKFHEEREAHPEKFDSRIGNKFQYFLLGNKSLFERNPKIGSILRLEGDVIEDGKEVKRKAIPIPPNCECLIFLNIPSYLGGSNPWGQSGGKNRWSEQSYNDKLVEVISVSGVTEFAMIKTGLQHGKRLAQISKAYLTFSEEIEVQMDGEPYKQGPGYVEITHFEQENLLINN